MWLRLPHPPIHGMCVCVHKLLLFQLLLLFQICLWVSRPKKISQEKSFPRVAWSMKWEKNILEQKGHGSFFMCLGKISHLCTHFLPMYFLFFFSTHTRKDSFSFIKLEVMLCVQDLKSLLSECTNELTGKRRQLH